MKQLIIITLIFTQAIFADSLKVIEKLSDIPKNKNVVLIFSMKYCPYCLRQEKSIIKRVQPKFKDIVYLKVMRGSKIFQELSNSGSFDQIQYYPTSFILKINQDNEMNVKYLFQGFQRSSNILSVLNDKEIMED